MQFDHTYDLCNFVVSAMQFSHTDSFGRLSDSCGRVKKILSQVKLFCESLQNCHTGERIKNESGNWNESGTNHEVRTNQERIMKPERIMNCGIFATHPHSGN